MSCEAVGSAVRRAVGAGLADAAGSGVAVLVGVAGWLRDGALGAGADTDADGKAVPGGTAVAGVVGYRALPGRQAATALKLDRTKTKTLDRVDRATATAIKLVSALIGRTWCGRWGAIP